MQIVGLVDVETGAEKEIKVGQRFSKQNQEQINPRVNQF